MTALAWLVLAAIILAAVVCIAAERAHVGRERAVTLAYFDGYTDGRAAERRVRS